MSLRYAQHFDIKEEIIAAGFLQAALLQPKPGAPPAFSLPVLFVNVYLACGSQDCNVRALQELRRRFPRPPRHVIIGGDWNMTEHPADSSGANDHYASTAKLRAELATTLAHFTLHEVYQPLHTRIREHQGSSRLDRFYISHSLAEKCLFVPETTLPPHPHLPGSGADKGPSDHFPIRLHFTNGSIAKGVRFKIPDWLAREEAFITKVRACLRSA